MTNNLDDLQKELELADRLLETSYGCVREAILEARKRIVEQMEGEDIRIDEDTIIE